MKEWILFALFMIVGLGMLISGIIYMQKEKDDMESVKIYRTVSAIGSIMVVLTTVLKFAF